MFGHFADLAYTLVCDIHEQRAEPVGVYKEGALVWDRATMQRAYAAGRAGLRPSPMAVPRVLAQLRVGADSGPAPGNQATKPLQGTRAGNRSASRSFNRVQEALGAPAGRWGEPLVAGGVSIDCLLYETALGERLPTDRRG